MYKNLYNKMCASSFFIETVIEKCIHYYNKTKYIKKITILDNIFNKILFFKT